MAHRNAVIFDRSDGAHSDDRDADDRGSFSGHRSRATQPRAAPTRHLQVIGGTRRSAPQNMSSAKCAGTNISCEQRARVRARIVARIALRDADYATPARRHQRAAEAPRDRDSCAPTPPPSRPRRPGRPSAAAPGSPSPRPAAAASALIAFVSAVLAVRTALSRLTTRGLLRRHHLLLRRGGLGNHRLVVLEQRLLILGVGRGQRLGPGLVAGGQRLLASRPGGLARLVRRGPTIPAASFHAA